MQLFMLLAIQRLSFLMYRQQQNLQKLPKWKIYSRTSTFQKNRYSRFKQCRNKLTKRLVKCIKHSKHIITKNIVSKNIVNI